MNNYPVYKEPVFLSDDLWGNRSLYSRSKDLTPLYINRFTSPRISKRITIHDFWEFTCVLEGAGRIICNKSLNLQKLTVCLIPPGFRHCEQSPAGMDTIWIAMKGGRMKSVSRKDIMSIRNKRICDAFEQIWLLVQHGQSLIGPELDGMMANITGMFFRMAFDGAAEQDNSCIERSICFFNENFAENHSIPEMAKRFGYSGGYYHHIFKQSTGMTPLAYITRLRCKHAAHLLHETNWSIARIAELSGYADQLYFSRIFKKIHGCCPREFRRKLKVVQIA